MAYPKKDVVRPRCLDGMTNGKLPANILVDTLGLGGGPVVRLVEPAARAWRAMTNRARLDGVILKATSLMDSYRPYTVQERIFRDRYTTAYLPGRPSKIWNGKRWYQKPRTAMAAVPGTSNHGLGITVDTGCERDGDPGTESLDAEALAWLLEHADTYGWSWEVQSEPWHIRYYRGDNIPAAVLAFENTNPAPTPAPPQEDDEVLEGFDKDPEDVARALIRVWCDEKWGKGDMTVADQEWILGEWRKHGRDHAWALICDHKKADNG